ncbi:MAG: type II toxin-antitoxin system RelE/ParE family toxin [Planctomycetes bacterium]|nr:type II toxin-antitoxin system RelE/ParE family toxin [Planctomycetota bacterium]
MMGDEGEQPDLKPLEWVASSKGDLIEFPIPVRKEMGFALYLAQLGARSPSAKALRGFGGAGVVEIVVTHDGNAYRGVYTVRFAQAIYVLHCFQKKSHRGIATPKPHIELIEQRLKVAEAHYQRHYQKRSS